MFPRYDLTYWLRAYMRNLVDSLIHILFSYIIESLPGACSLDNNKLATQLEMGEQVPLSVVLVTGGCGFIPSNFINNFLRSSNAKIVNYDRLTPVSNKANVISSLAAPEQYIFIGGDICNRALLNRVLRRYDVDAVVHFAAQTHVGDSYKDPQEFVKCNTEGTVTLLEACRAYGRIKRFVYVSTDEVYGDSGRTSLKPKTELDILQPTNPYAASKASAEHFVGVYHMSYGFPAVVVRMCNAYGPRQSLDKVVPKFIQQAASGKPFTIHGDGNQLRSFMHVSDTCAAISVVLTKGNIGQVYNVGTTFEISVTDLAKEIQKTVDTVIGRETTAFEVVYVEDRPHNDQRYHLDAGKLKAELGWEEKISFQEGLKQTVSWYLQNQGAKPDREKILVYGAKGWIGGQFVSILEKEGVEYTIGEKRLGDDHDESIEAEILSASPTHVASFIGRVHGPGNSTCDYVEGGPDKVAINVRDNLYGPLLLAELCRKFGIHFTYIGSGCLFKYDEEHPVGGKPFTEEDMPNHFGGSYAVVKGYTDRLMHHYNNVLNVRIRFPLSDDTSPRNTITKITSYKRIMSVPNSVTVLPDLLPVLLKLMKKRHTGTLNFVNPGCVEHTEILEAYKEMVDPSLEYEVIDENDESELARRLRSTRCNCCLSTDLLRKLAPEVSDAKEAVHSIMKKRVKV